MNEPVPGTDESAHAMHKLLQQQNEQVAKVLQVLKEQNVQNEEQRDQNAEMVAILKEQNAVLQGQNAEVIQLLQNMPARMAEVRA